MPEQYMSIYKQWLTDAIFDEETHAELLAIEGDNAEIEDRFYKELEFGTAGMRGILGAGTNRMNVYTVGKATQGLCDMLLAQRDGTASGGAANSGAASAGALNGAAGGAELSIAIAFDPRLKSVEFAEECAMISAGNGIHAYLFDDIRPTPELSFAVRHLHCSAGIMITASHNPSQYNGYKAYGADGAQMSVEDSNRLAQYASRLESYSSIKKTGIDDARNAGLLTIIGADIDDIYIDKIQKLSLRLSDLTANGDILSRFKIVYTPLHGTGNKPIRRILHRNGFKNIIVVPEQELPDPLFSTVASPNPENRSAFELAMALATRENADIIIGTDPDNDRIGVIFKNNAGDFEGLTGNQIGCLLMEYVLDARQSAGTLDKEHAFVIKSIVTTKLADLIAANYGVKIYEVYTGFKYICKTVKDRDEFGDEEFIFGFEESNGFLAGTFVRDKDASIAAMLITEMAAWHRTQGRSLAGALKEIYERYGYTIDDVVSYTLEGKEGHARIASTMEHLRNERPASFGCFNVSKCTDYLTDEIIETGRGVTGATGMDETSNVLAYQMTDGSVFLIRPSGTEPKIKIYFGVTDETRDAAEKLLRDLQDAVASEITKLLGT